MNRYFWVAAVLLALQACAPDAGERSTMTQAEKLCPQWGFAPNDPACLRLFRRDAP